MIEYVSDCVACGAPDCTGCPRARLRKAAICDECREEAPQAICEIDGKFLCGYCARQKAITFLQDLDVEDLVQAVNDYSSEYIETWGVEDYLSDDSVNLQW